ncbi:MAG: GntR family transcriptional regulator [Lachnospiraceae bacterium]|nr:GntR family transcriptional regulator [Lachnospiraceae bacterium]
MNILISQLSQTPIYEQMENQIRQSILSGELKPNEMLPSIRRLAKDLGVGIITVKRAYDDLCNEGLLVSLQGRGVFVAQIDAGQEKNIRLEQLRSKLEEIRQYCDAASITKAELMAQIDKIYQKDKEEGK